MADVSCGRDVRVTLYQGDCLDVLPGLPDASVDAVITDPPYLIGGSSIGNPKSKSGTWPDVINAARWYASWYRECWRLLGPAGYFLTFCNWRTLPTVICALSQCQITATSCLVWDKEWIGTGAKSGLRSRHEMIVLAGKPAALIADRAAADVVRCRWNAGACRTTSHPAEKPHDLLLHLVNLVTPAAGVVLDPFAGSGSAGLACQSLGRSFIGVEADPAFHAEAAQRLRAAGAVVNIAGPTA